MPKGGETGKYTYKGLFNGGDMARSGSGGRDYRSESERVKPRASETSLNEESFQAETLSDRNLQRIITERMSREPELATSLVEVHVRAGIVILNGSTDTVNTKYQLEQLVKRVEGVQKIENHLKIRIGEAFEEFSRHADAARLRAARVRASKRS